MRPWDSRRGRIIACIVLLAVAIGIGYPLDRCNERSRARYDYAFPDLQKAASPEEAKGIVGKWNETKGANAGIRTTIWVDVAFALFYAPFGALLAYWVSLGRPTPWVARLGRWIALAALGGGAADLVENAFMLGMLGQPETAASLFWPMHVFTSIKGLGLLLAWCYIVLAHLDRARRATA